VFFLEIPTDIHSICPLYESQNKEGEIVIDLLYLEKEGATHYCLLKNGIDCLIRKNDNKRFACRRCFNCFCTEQALNNHKILCNNNPLAKTVLPKEGETLKFSHPEFIHKLPVAIYCDFEAMNKPIEHCKPTSNNPYKIKISKQEITSFWFYVKSIDDTLIKSKYYTYTGKILEKNLLHNC